jgi:predicted O-methyltransferase YrrM
VSKTFDEVLSRLPEGDLSETLLKVEAKALFDACSQVPAGGIVIETGCQLGRSSSLISQVGYDRKYHTIHIDPYTQQPEWAKAWIEMMMKLVGDWDHEIALLCMRTEQAAWLLSKIGQIDMAYIDGDHEYEGVMKDLELIVSRIRPGGMFAAHDYARECLPGVRKAIQPYVEAGGWQHVGTFGSLGVWRRM